MPIRARRLPQRGAGFGERLANAFADVRELGYDEIVAIPSDVPGLRSDHLHAAFRKLGRGRTVLGPCPDGGVYLIGARGPVGTLLEGVRWQTGAVLSDLRRRALDAVLLAPLTDVDRWHDLTRLASEDGLDDDLCALIRLVRAARPYRSPASAPAPARSGHLWASIPRGPPPTLLV
jgi:hypothetical protein